MSNTKIVNELRKIIHEEMAYARNLVSEDYENNINEAQSIDRICDRVERQCRIFESDNSKD